MNIILEPVAILAIILVFNYLLRQSLNRDRREKSKAPRMRVEMSQHQQRATG